MKDMESILSSSGIKPTSNRILVLRELMNSSCPLSLGDLDIKIGTLEKSSILRTLTIFHDNHIVHTIEDGRGVIKYELCTGHSHGDEGDMHVHFYCESCKKVCCFEDISVPRVVLPEEYYPCSVNYMIKGICPECNKTLATNHK